MHRGSFPHVHTVRFSCLRLMVRRVGGDRRMKASASSVCGTRTRRGGGSAPSPLPHGSEPSVSRRVLVMIVARWD